MSSYIFEYLTYLYGLHIYKLIIAYLNVLHRCMFVTKFILLRFCFVFIAYAYCMLCFYI